MKLYIKMVCFTLLVTVAVCCGTVSMASTHCSCETHAATVAQTEDLSEGIALQADAPVLFVSQLVNDETVAPDHVAGTGSRCDGGLVTEGADSYQHGYSEDVGCAVDQTEDAAEETVGNMLNTGAESVETVSETVAPTDAAPVENVPPVVEETQPAETEPPHVHSYAATDTVAPGCECDGYTVYECSCGSSYMDDYVSAKGHSWGEWVTVKEPTADAAGEQSRDCNKCGESQVEAVFMAAAPVEPGQEDSVVAEKIEGTKQEVELKQEDATEKVEDVKQEETAENIEDVKQEEAAEKVEDEKREEEQKGTAESENKPDVFGGYDYVGRWCIPSVGVDVGIYGDYYVETAPGSGDYVLLKKRQERVDNVDSAVYFELNGVYVIGDHNYQGFNAIKQCSVGATAYLDGVLNGGNYRCVAVIQGHNTRDDLTDLNYVSIGALYPGATVCYTCNDSARNVTIVVFYPA